MYNNNEIPQRIRDLTSDRKITINELAKRSRLTQSTINSIINENKNPTLKTIVKICNGLNISVTDFFDFPPYNKKKEADKINF